MTSTDYSIGYVTGQLVLLNALISNCEEDITYLIDESFTLKKGGASKALTSWNGKIEAMEAIKTRLGEAYWRLKKKEKELRLFYKLP